MKTGLVLEGGGMRGMYTIGVLDCLMEHNIQADYCIGVSAGACNGISYVAGQRGRSKRININYVKEPKYVGVGNYLTTGSLFGMDYIFDVIPNELEPFDYPAFFASPCQFVVGATDVETGKPTYFGVEALDHDTTVLRASSSIPIFSPIVPYKGRKYLDGGTSDPIPVQKALADGCTKAIVVLTRHRAYRKKPEQMKHLYHRVLRQYPAMVQTLDNRHLQYNHTLALVKQLEKEGKVFVIAPKEPLAIGRFERNPKKLSAAWDVAYQDTLALLPKLLAFLSQAK